MTGNRLTVQEAMALNRNDVDLFGHRACNIFAVALKRSGLVEPSNLLRLEVNTMGQIYGAYHVVVRRGDAIFDIHGGRVEREYLAGLQEHLLKLNRAAGFVPEILGPREVTESELLAQVCRTPAGAWLNSWRQFTGDQFVRIATERAERVISRWPASGGLRSL